MIDLLEVKNLKDDDLKKYLNDLKNRKPSEICSGCGRLTPTKQQRVGLSVYKPEYVQSYKLCNLCNDCYVNLLEYIGINDIG